MTDKVTAGFIPLVDAAALLVAADFGFAEAEGLEIELVREVSWANVREKLSAGIFDVAHLLAPDGHRILTGSHAGQRAFDHALCARHERKCDNRQPHALPEDHGRGCRRGATPARHGKGACAHRGAEKTRWAFSAYVWQHLSIFVP